MLDTDQLILDELKRVNDMRKSGDGRCHLPIVDASIPKTATISCPLNVGKATFAYKCPGCERFDGVAQQTWSDKEEISWGRRYRIRCKTIVERSCGDIL